jgi:hypothetical protein
MISEMVTLYFEMKTTNQISKTQVSNIIASKVQGPITPQRCFDALFASSWITAALTAVLDLV